MSNNIRKAFIELHVSILLAGWTGIFGKLIAMSPGLIVFWRIFIAGTVLWLWGTLTGRIQSVKGHDKLGIMAVGALLMLQWVMFYCSIKVSNVSICVVAFSSMGFFTALFEPLFEKRWPHWRDLAFSVITLFGISLIFTFDASYRLGIAFGLLSAAMAAVLAILFRFYRKRYSSETVMSWQLTGGLIGALVLLPFYTHFMPAEPFFPDWLNLGYLFIFAIPCTLGMYILQIQSLRSISAFTVNLSYNLEPVYSIILAMIIFHEGRELGGSFYAGVACIILSVALQTMTVLKSDKRQNRRAIPRQSGDAVDHAR